MQISNLCLSVAPAIRLPEDGYGRQPLQTGNLHLVGDIRIDNRAELGQLLGWSAPYARSQADSAFFLAAWVRWGQAALDRIVGGFAVAVWDASNRQLFLIRDHVGERSLYFVHHAGTIAFASLPAPLRTIPEADTSLDEDRLIHYLALLPGSATQTFFKNIQQLPPGHLVTFESGSMVVRRYWHPMDAPSVRFKSDDEYVEAFREHFDHAVQARLRTTGGVASQLSAGLDSSSVTVTAARLLNAQCLAAFTSVPRRGYDNQVPVGRFGDEGPAAAEVAAMYPNIDHIPVDSSQQELLVTLRAMNRLQGEPVFNPLNEMWMSAMVEHARSRGITVMLQGACGNASISAGGMIGLSEFFRTGRWVQLAKLALELRKRGHASLRGIASWAAGPVLPQWLWRRMNQQASDFDFRFSPLLPQIATANHLADKTWKQFYSQDRSVEGHRRQNFDFYDVGFANVATTLGFQIELRDPTQDKRIFEYCYAIPIEQYLVGGQTRSLVRRAMRGHLPESTLTRTTRGLQSADWFLTMGARLREMKEELEEIRKSPLATHILDVDRLEKLLANWPSRGFESSEVSDSWHLALIRGLSVGNFIRQFE